MPTTRSIALAMLALAAAAVGGASPAMAAGPAVTCGATLTANAALTADLTCPDGNGITLGSGVTLNLRGHTLNGSGSGTAVTFGDSGPNRLVNGSITNWGLAVRVVPDFPAGLYTVSQVHVSGTRGGVEATISSVAVTACTFDGTDTAIRYSGSQLTVRGSSFRNSTYGIDVYPGSISVATSSFIHNQWAIYAVDAGVTVDRTAFVSNGTATYVYGPPQKVTRSTFVDNESALNLAQEPTYGPNMATISGNLFQDNTRSITAEHGGANITGNRFVRNVETFDGAPRATLTGNTFTDNTNGINVQPPPPDSDLTYVTSLGTNTSIGNSGWGIYAPGATDLGGNVARQNGNRPQCIGVVCTPR